MEDTSKNRVQNLADSLEIVELDDRLDMAFDPLSLVTSATRKPKPPNTNCLNTQCCGAPPVIVVKF